MRHIIAGKRLERQLKEIIDNYLAQGKQKSTDETVYSPTISYFIGVLEEDQEFLKLAGLNEKVEHVGASMIKVLIMECLFHQARMGKLSLQDTMTLAEVPRVSGGGALQELLNHHKFSLLELSRLMMTLSDNWATNLLLHKLGMDSINARIHELGMPELKLERQMMDTMARQEGKENRITALGMAKLYNHLYQIREETLYGNEMWNILKHQQFRDKIPFFWGEETPFFHKTGSLDCIEHDGGVYVTLMGAYVVVILVSGLHNGLAIQMEAAMGECIRAYLDTSVPLLDETVINYE